MRVCLCVCVCTYECVYVCEYVYMYVYINHVSQTFLKELSLAAANAYGVKFFYVCRRKFFSWRSLHQLEWKGQCTFIEGGDSIIRTPAPLCTKVMQFECRLGDAISRQRFLSALTSVFHTASSHF